MNYKNDEKINDLDLIHTSQFKSPNSSLNNSFQYQTSFKDYQKKKQDNLQSPEFNEQIKSNNNFIQSNENNKNDIYSLQKKLRDCQDQKQIIQSQLKMKQVENNKQIELLLDENNQFRHQIFEQIEQTEYWKQLYKNQDKNLPEKHEMNFKSSNDLEQELNDLKMKFNSLQIQRNNEFEKQKQIQEENTILTRELRELTVKLKKEKSIYQQEYNQIGDTQNIQYQELQDWQQKYRQLEDKFENLQKHELNNQDIEKKYSNLQQDFEYQQNIQNIQQQQFEKTKQNLLLQIKELEFQLNENLKDYQEKLRRNDLDVQDDSNRVSQLQKDIIGVKKELDISCNHLNMKNQQYENIKNQLQQQEQQLNNYIKDLVFQIKRKDQEFYDEQNKNSSLRKEIESLKMIELKYIDAEQKIIILTQEHQYLTQKINDNNQQDDLWNSNLQNLQIELKKTENQKYQLQERVSQQQLELERLNQSFKNQTTESQYLKDRLKNIDQEILEYQTREIEQDSRIQWMLKDLNSSRSVIEEQDQCDNIIRNQKSKILELEGQNILQKQEIGKTNMILEQKIQQNEKFTINNKYSEQQLIQLGELQINDQRQNKEIQEQLQNIQQLQQNLQDCQQDCQELTKLLKEKEVYEEKYKDLDMNSKKIVSDNQELCQQVQELNKLAKIVHEREGQINIHNKENQRLINANNEIQQKLDDLQQEFQTLQFNYNDLQNDIEDIPLLSNELKRLQDEILEKDIELDQWKEKYVEYNSLVLRVKEDLTVFVLLFAQIESLRDRVDEKDKELEQLKQTYIKSVYKQ